MDANETISPSQIHTPGPWVVRPQPYRKGFKFAVCGDDFWPAAVFSDGRNNAGTAEANARLIAAAPDLLDALRECAAALATARAFHKGRPPWVETDEAALVAARAAIDKAIGG